MRSCRALLQALAEVLPAVRAEKVAAGGFWVLRPDSGDPTDAVLAGLRAADATFGEKGGRTGGQALAICAGVESCYLFF